MTKQREYFDPYDDPSALLTLEKVKKVISKLKSQFEEGHGESGFHLATLLTPVEPEVEESGAVCIPSDIQKILGCSVERASQYYAEAFVVLQKNADDGDTRAMDLLAMYYQTSLPPLKQCDPEKMEYWTHKSLVARREKGEVG